MVIGSLEIAVSQKHWAPFLQQFREAAPVTAESNQRQISAH